MGYKVKNDYLSAEEELMKKMELYGFSIELPDEEDESTEKEEKTSEKEDE